jgi:DNA-directed RNA polymerase subunit RPC12/RpoP
MATIRFACPACNAAFTVPATKAGHKATCPRCSQRILIPASRRNVTALGKLLPPDCPPGPLADRQFPPQCAPPEAAATSAPLPGDLGVMPANRTRLFGFVAFGAVVLVAAALAVVVVVARRADVRENGPGGATADDLDRILRSPWWQKGMTKEKLERIVEAVRFTEPGYFVTWNRWGDVEADMLPPESNGKWERACQLLIGEDNASRDKALFLIAKAIRLDCENHGEASGL